MERFSNSTREVGQSGRRGACLLGLDISHPQSRDFINVKTDRTKITGANISLKLDDNFMQAVINNSEYELKFNNEVWETVNARELWNDIINQAHDNAEPGVFFWDRMFEYDPVSVYPNHQIVLTNACSEIPMSSLDACRLVLINLYSVIENPFTENAKLNEDLLYKISYQQIRLADNLVDFRNRIFR
jgi:ribonucleoside-diphosphate reductase alpha chain